MKAPGTLGFRLLSLVLKPLFIILYRPKIIGKENIPKKGAVVIAGNHLHVLDQCMVIAATKRPVNYMAKSEYFEGPFKWFFKAAGCICVYRNSHDKAAKDAALAVLKRGGALGIFPEGTRNRTRELLMPFKFGAVSLAEKTGAKIVPVAVSGDYKLFGKNLVIRIGEPFSPDQMTLEEANNKLRNDVMTLLLKNLADGYTHPKSSRTA